MCFCACSAMISGHVLCRALKGIYTQQFLALLPFEIFPAIYPTTSLCLSALSLVCRWLLTPGSLLVMEIALVPQCPNERSLKASINGLDLNLQTRSLKKSSMKHSITSNIWRTCKWKLEFISITALQFRQELSQCQTFTPNAGIPASKRV